MISLITCSVKPDVCRRMLDSVSKTIGAEYETIVFDNREKNVGICKAYNESAKNANGDYLCFVHEDIVFATEGWGKRLVDFVNRTDNCGVVGLAGGKNALKNFFDWGGDGRNAVYRYYYDPLVDIKTANENYGVADLICRYRNPENEEFSKAVALDGLFLFTRRDVWEENPFDENTFTGFHFYDADFSFAAAQKRQNYVCLGMDVYHFSNGNKEKTFCENMLLFQKKWDKHLPYCLPGYKTSLVKELMCAGVIFRLYRQNGFSILESLKKIADKNGAAFTALLCGYLIARVPLKFIAGRSMIVKRPE